VSDPVRLDLAEVAAAAARLAQARGPAALVSSLLDLVRAWAAPSAAFAAVRDAASGGGWRVLPGVVLGSVPVGIERTLARLVEDAPEALARGGIVQRGEEIAGVKARDNWAVPFWTGEQSGALFLRGVPRPAPDGLGEALALATAVAWPRLLGSPAERLESLVSDVQAAAERLAAEARRQLEALETNRPSPKADEAAEDAATPTPVEDGRVAALEGEVRALEAMVERLGAEARAAQGEADDLRGERNALRVRAESTEPLAAAVQDARMEAETLKAEVGALRERAARTETLAEEAAAARAETDALKAEAETLRERAARTESFAEEAAAARAETDALKAEAETLRERAARAESLAEEAAAARAEADALKAEAKTLRERAARTESFAEEAAAARAEADALKAEAETLRERAARTESFAEEAAAARAEADAFKAEAEALRERAAKKESLAEEAATTRAEAESLRERVATAEPLLAERALLAERLETLRRSADAADVRGRKAEEELAAAQRDLALARARSGQHDEERRQRLEDAEARARAIGEQWEAARHALRAATAAVRRAAFLPPAVRVSFREAVGPDEGEGRAAPWMSVVVLDRDAVSLETVAEALERSGLDVRLAGHPEEIALLLRTSDATGLGAVVCDVMAFRPDQNVAGLIRAWDKDRPGLAYFLSFDAENAAEVERARRIPTSIIAGHVPRPLSPARFLETLETLAKRRGRIQP
jgi:hypothetical protein